MNETELKDMHNRSNYHRTILQESKLCGCFYCRRTYEPGDIKEWCDGGETALCANCGIDSVLPLDDSVDNTSMLEEMSMYWFNFVYNEDGRLVHNWSK
jgi:hypothetical protein